MESAVLEVRLARCILVATQMSPSFSRATGPCPSGNASSGNAARAGLAPADAANAARMASASSTAPRWSLCVVMIIFFLLFLAA